MLLAIDVGNSETVVGLVERMGGSAAAAGTGEVVVRERWRVGTYPSRTSDEWVVLLDGLLSGYGDVPEERIDGVAICATVPSVLHELRRVVSRNFNHLECLVVGPGVRTGVAVRVDNPREVGADRVVNSLAALETVGAPAIVVDCGTATTFDVVGADGAYVGGAIAPGVEVAMQALGQRGAQLPQVELSWPRSVIASNTVEALQSGVLFGFLGQVEGVLDRMLAELGVRDDGPGTGAVSIVATGGLGGLLASASDLVDRYEPDLTLVGLRLMWERNSGARRPGT
jgi:type III pantothenate kinase